MEKMAWVSPVSVARSLSVKDVTGSSSGNIVACNIQGGGTNNSIGMTVGRFLFGRTCGYVCGEGGFLSILSAVAGNKNKMVRFCLFANSFSFFHA